MSIQVIFGGNTYQIPETGERGWGSLTDYLVALSTASSTGSFSQAVRTSTSASTNVATTDFSVLINYAGAATVTLPTGALKQIFAVFDASGLASTNNITISGTGGQQINGASSYVIKSNYGGILVQFDGTQFRILSEYTGGDRFSTNNAMNASFVDASIIGKGAFPSVSDGTQSSVTFSSDTNSYVFLLSLNSGETLLCAASYLSAGITALNDGSNIILPSDAGVGIYISKSASSAVITFKSRFGVSKNIEIRSLTARIASATAWA